MDNELARYIVYKSFQAQSVLTDLIPFLKKNLSEEESKKYSIAIAKSITKINEEITELTKDINPGITQDISNKIKKYGHYF